MLLKSDNLDRKRSDNMAIMDSIKARRSIRCYKHDEVPTETIEKIQRKIDSITPLFDAKLRFSLVNIQHLSGMKLGTYGVISGASYFLVACYQKSEYAKLSLGYAMEEIILYCTELGLGTCFLGGTYRKSAFAKAVNLQKGEIISLISPIGYPTDNLTLMARMMGSSNEVKSRKPFPSIVFEMDYLTPIKHDNEFKQPLEMFRLAPSAMNAQPWCALVDQTSVHFFTSKANAGYAQIDLGIAMCNFDLTRLELGIKGKFEYREEVKNLPYKKLDYVYSFVKDKENT